MRIWELNTLEVDFTSYYLPESDKKDFFIEMMADINDESKHVDKWTPLVLLKKEQRIDPDFFDLYDTGALITTEKGSALFEAFCNLENFQLLPFINDEQKFFLFHLIKATDCLDKDNSVFELHENGIIADYESLTFNYDAIKDPVFKIPELPYTLFVTGDFKHYYDELELKGIDFDEEYMVI
ncbi:hypothetical protein LJC72_07040 [Bacteroides sp. OttesenSCG-928-D19]|nr:hypothetical protein [Bacteroides sp. OttesenSCG-928-D19]